MSAAACKIVIDCAARLVGKLLCLAGAAPIADNSSPGSVSLDFAQRFERVADRFGEVVDTLIEELNAVIPQDAPAGDPSRPPAGRHQPGRGD